MKGYKAFERDLTCRGKQYEIGVIFEEDVTPEPCERGMHFCEHLPNVFQFYPFDPNKTRVAEVEALGDVVMDQDGVKFCTNRLRIIREIPWDEIQKACNTGDRNTGDRNTGNWNTGNRNTGDRNTGNRNTGNWNTGDWNKSSFNNGCFMTEEPKIMLFNKPSDWTYCDWLNSEARYYLNKIPRNIVEWVWSGNMTEEEKAAHPEYKTTDGYLKVLDEADAAQVWWDGTDARVKEIIKALPNFDVAIFKDCTGIEVK